MTNTTCSFVLGPCVDGTKAGYRCSGTAVVSGRCVRHAQTQSCYAYELRPGDRIHRTRHTLVEVLSVTDHGWQVGCTIVFSDETQYTARESSFRRVI